MDASLGLNFPILMDGAMGTQLAARGLEMGGENCLTNPDAVFSIHKSYVDAGCDILATNTLAMNPIYAESHGVLVSIADANAAGVRLARKAATKDQRVFGELGPTGQMLAPYGDYSEDEFFGAFRTQAEQLAHAGADGFIMEAMMDLREALCAVRACRAAASLPVILSFAFQMTDRGPRTLMGNSIQEICDAAGDVEIAAIGANCGDFDPARITEIADLFREATLLPVIVQPNAGAPHLASGGNALRHVARGVWGDASRMPAGGREHCGRVLRHDAGAYPAGAQGTGGLDAGLRG